MKMTGEKADTRKEGDKRGVDGVTDNTGGFLNREDRQERTVIPQGQGNGQ